jgi:magnesium-transporting ATPase (P-type)
MSVTDGPPAIALGFNPSDPHIMKQKPRSRHTALLTNAALVKHTIVAAYVAFATLGAFTWWFRDNGMTLSQLMHWNDQTTASMQMLMKDLTFPRSIALTVVVVLGASSTY